MPDLLHTFHGRDLGFLKMIAGLWGIDLDAPNVRAALPQLVRGMLNADLANEIVDSLPESAREALHTLIEQGGALPWMQFARQFGDVQNLGAAKRDRERPDLNPRTPTEMLWYYGLIGQAFMDQPPEPQQFAFIPDDLLAILHPAEDRSLVLFGRPASPGEIAVIQPVSDRVLDHACTLLAALRLGMVKDQIPTTGWTIPLPNLQALLASTGLVDGSGLPLSEPVRLFLEASRSQALLTLASSWLDSLAYNELRLLPGLVFEGDWTNYPQHARSRIIEHLSRLPQNTWWSLQAFISDMRQKDPDFQRPAGDYESWFIRRSNDNQYLSGFTSWDEVDGAVIRALITGPLHWLGFYDVAAPTAGEPPSAFRPSAWSASLWMRQQPDSIPDETASVTIHMDGRMMVPRLTRRALRYQLARFTTWISEDDNGYIYQITPAALEKARQQGLKPSQLVGLIKKAAVGPIPPTILTALDRWDQHGSEAHLEKAVLLRISRPEILTALRKLPVNRYLGEELNPTTILIRAGGVDAVLKALTELGYLGEVHFGSEV